MDLGCLDLGCISVLDKHSNETGHDSGSKESDKKEPGSSNSKVGKKLSPRATNQSAFNALNKVTSQIRKPSYRKTSPLNWFPRKKMDSYLKRKIQKLQEVDGMNLTLDETLGDTNPHYSRVLREKMAAREAAHKAMEARRAALVEASWCRILKAARIQSKEAEALLSISEKTAVEAFEAAAALGVIMFDIPNCPAKHCQIETSSANEGKSTTHTIRASFETPFDVDKEVAAALKTAFTRLANCPSLSKDELKDILHKIRENPDTGDTNQELSELSSDCESESGSELETVSQNDSFVSQDLDSEVEAGETSQKKSKRRQSLGKLNKEKLIEMMLERIKSLQEDELSSLATIVATCGLNAALADGETSKTHHYPSSGINSGRRMSTLGVRPVKNDNELPSLDKFLVKHMTKLEREVLEARNSRINESNETTGLETDVESDKDSDLASVLAHKHSSKFEKEIEEAKKNSRSNLETVHKKKSDSNEDSSGNVPDLGSILVKHSSKLEKEIAETKRNNGKIYVGKRTGRMTNRDTEEVPGLDKFLVKHVSRLEKEVQEAKIKRNITSTSSSSGGVVDKENVNLNMKARNEETTADSLDKILIKPVSRLEREKMQALSVGNNYANNRSSEKKQGLNNNNTDHCDSLDKVLVKHVSRLEKEKMRFNASEEGALNVKRREANVHSQANGEEGSLDQVLVKHVSRLEKEKMRFKASEGGALNVKRREANLHSQANGEEGSLDQVLVKHKSRLEREKMMASAEQPEGNQIKHSLTRRQAREKELQEAWGGLSLGNSMKPHLSKLQRDKEAWIKAEDEARMQATKEV